MLKIENRLKKRKEFAYIYKKGVKTYGQNITCYKVPSKYPTPRIGFSVSNKVGKAVVRNKVKRRMRAIVSEIVPQIKNCNIVFVAHPSIVNLEFDQIKNEIKSLLIKGKIIDENI